MRTIDEEEALEIADVIHKLGTKLYGEKGAKFLEEAKKFLNEEPCWVEEESIHPFYGRDFGHERICIIGGLHGRSVSARVHHGEVFMIDAQMDIESFGAVREPNFFEGLTDVIKRVKALGCNFSFPPLEMREEMPIMIIRQNLEDALLREDFQSILQEEEGLSKKHYRNNQSVFQRKHEHYFRSKAHTLKTCNARIFRGPWLARGNIAQF